MSSYIDHLEQKDIRIAELEDECIEKDRYIGKLEVKVYDLNEKKVELEKKLAEMNAYSVYCRRFHPKHQKRRENNDIRF